MALKKTSVKATPIKTATSELKEELLRWICERHATNGPLDRKLLREKALELATSCGATAFKCSEAWLTVFLKKHGFSPSLTTCSGPTFPDFRVWVKLLRSLITRFRHKDLFNVDELVMYSDFVPERILPLWNPHGEHETKRRRASASPSGRRIALAMCCNSSGTEKLPLLISGPYPPRISGNDCHYHEGSCITEEVFSEWLSGLNRDMARDNRRILLLLNRERIRASGKLDELSHVELLYFPRELPSHLRPLRGDVFHCLKMNYRRKYAEHLRSRDEVANRKWEQEEVLESLVQAWRDVPRELVVSSFQRTKFREDDSFLRIECPSWEDLGTGISFKKFVTFDDDLSDKLRELRECEERSVDTRHRYNLRNTGWKLETLELEASLGLLEGSSRARTGSGRRRVAAASERGNESQDKSVNETQGTSGLGGGGRKVSVEVHSVELTNSYNSRIREEDRRPRGDNRHEERLADGIRNFCEGGRIDDMVEREEGRKSGGDGRLNDFTNGAREQSGGEGSRGGVGSSESRLTDYEGKFPGKDIEGEGYLRAGDSIEEVNWNSERDEATSWFVEGGEAIQNFPGEVAGPSGSEERAARAGGRAREEPSRGGGEFDEDEDNEEGQQLELKILEAIEGWEGIERSESDGNSEEDVEDFRRRRRRRRIRRRYDGDVDGQRETDEEEAGGAKRRRGDDEGWSKRYETNFVFGPQLEASVSARTNEEQSGHGQEVANRKSTTKSKKTQTQTGELEKRCIFTLEGNPPGRED